MNKKYSFPALMLALLLCVQLGAAAFADEVHLCRPVSVQLSVDGEEHLLQCLEAGGENNIYVSLRSLASALSGSGREFSYEYISDYFGAPAYMIRTGSSYSGNNGALESEESVYLTLKRYRIYADDTERKYYAYDYGEHDIFASLPDVQFMLNAQFRFLNEKLEIATPDAYDPDLPAAAMSGILESIGALVVGDTKTGEIIFAYHEKEALSIASLTKLMTYIVMRESPEIRGIDENTPVPLSEKVIALSKSENGMIPLESGDTLTLRELINGMLVPSSNECTLAVAELSAGSENKCTDRMNLFARRLGLDSAEFINSHGLPVYENPVFPAKLQNIMSAEDLFELVCYLLKTYPEITEITSQQYIRLDSIDYSLANSNPLIFNMTAVNGLKTGTTDRAGYSLAATMPVKTADGKTHTIAVIELGAETQTDRGRISELALRWAEKYYQENGFAKEYPGETAGRLP